MTELEVVTSTLEQCAELDVDLTPRVYEVFFETCADSVPLMGHSDLYMRGRMLEQVFELILDESSQGPGSYLHWEVDNHVSAYGVGVDMYDAFFTAIKEAVKRPTPSAPTP